MTRKKAKASAKHQSLRYPTDAEQEAIAAARETYARRPGRVALSLTTGEQPNAIELAPAHNDVEGGTVHLADTLASKSLGFRALMMNHLGNVMCSLGGKQITEDQMNGGLAIIAAVEPQNELEAILGIQIAATNDLALKLLARGTQAPSIEIAERYVAQATKLQRTLNAQLETLGKMRRGGEQVVRHIHVDNRGGQAVIAENVHTGGVNGRGEDQSHGQSTLSPALLGQDPLGYGLPMPRDKGEEAMSAPRRPEPRRAARQ